MAHASIYDPEIKKVKFTAPSYVPNRESLRSNFLRFQNYQELCAAVLLTNLYKTAIQSLKISIVKTFFCSDSTIALDWIKAKPHTKSLYRE